MTEGGEADSGLRAALELAPITLATRLTEAESTLVLLERARSGDRQALDSLFSRYVPLLRSWASGKLPQWARDLTDTHDLVQETLLQTFKKIDTFEYRGEGALRAYLYQVLVNLIRAEFRRAARRPDRTDLDDRQTDPSPSPLEETIGGQTIDRYEQALAQLRPEEREIIVSRVELGLSYEEMAATLGKPSPEAARKAARRALLRLAQAMDRG